MHQDLHCGNGGVQTGGDFFVGETFDPGQEEGGPLLRRETAEQTLYALTHLDSYGRRFSVDGAGIRDFARRVSLSPGVGCIERIAAPAMLWAAHFGEAGVRTDPIE